MKGEHKGQCVVLFSSMVTNQLFEVAWRKLETTLKGKAVTFTPIDGADADNKPKRSALWDVSTERKYPQVFFVTDSDIRFVGDMDKIQEMLEVGQFEPEFAPYVS